MSLIMIDSVIKANKIYYPQRLLEECKYIQEKIKTENHINKDLEKVNQTVTLTMRLNLILIMKNNLLKIVHALFYSLLCLGVLASRYLF